jgi:hypothetical protein
MIKVFDDKFNHFSKNGSYDPWKIWKRASGIGDTPPNVTVMRPPPLQVGPGMPQKRPGDPPSTGEPPPDKKQDLTPRMDLDAKQTQTETKVDLDHPWENRVIPRTNPLHAFWLKTIPKGRKPKFKKKVLKRRIDPFNRSTDSLRDQFIRNYNYYKRVGGAIWSTPKDEFKGYGKSLKEYLGFTE